LIPIGRGFLSQRRQFSIFATSNLVVQLRCAAPPRRVLLPHCESLFDLRQTVMTPKSETEMFDPKDFLAKVGEGKTLIEFQKNQKVFSQGDVADTVFYIQNGKVKLTVISEQGKEAVVAILEPGQFFGEGCMNGHPKRIATTTAMEDCLITAITKPAMIAALHDEPAFSELFMAYLLTRNSRIEEDLIDQLFNSSEKRLARLLLLLANFGKEGSPQPISPNVSQETFGRDDRHHPFPRQSLHEQVS
jgi:CRP/FNR family cyclic AMP-dependent transcriptional regulator